MGRDKTFRLQPVERGVDSTCHHLAIEAMLYFLENRPAVRFSAELGLRIHERQQDGLFQSSEVRRHSVYIVDKTTTASIYRSCEGLWRVA